MTKVKKSFDMNAPSGSDAYFCAQMSQWIAQILGVMCFLVSKQVVHADLATRNILKAEN